MKKIFAIGALLFSCAIELLAWDPHSQTDLVYASSNKTGLWFTAKENVSFSYSMKSIDSSITDFGVYYLNKDNTIASSKSLSLDGGDIKMNADDMLAFWYEENGKFYSSVKSLNDESGVYFGGRETNKDGRWFYFERNDTANRVAGIFFDAPTPAGQPLPGMLLTLAIFCFPLAFAGKFLKHK